MNLAVRLPSSGEEGEGGGGDQGHLLMVPLVFHFLNPES